MFGRKRRSRLDEVVEAVEPYAQTARDVVADQEARRRGIAALASLLLLRRRLLATTGIAGLAWRLANDPQLRGQLNQLAGDLGEFKGRAQRARARRRRRILVGLVGSGAAASAAVAYARSRGPVDVEDSVEVGVPVETAYNQWTQFEEFPRFMEGVDEFANSTTRISTGSLLRQLAINGSGTPRSASSARTSASPGMRSLASATRASSHSTGSAMSGAR
jgi:hypothetical protein